MLIHISKRAPEHTSTPEGIINLTCALFDDFLAVFCFVSWVDPP
jgi:hypothetical protein